MCTERMGVRQQQRTIYSPSYTAPSYRPQIRLRSSKFESFSLHGPEVHSHSLCNVEHDFPSDVGGVVTCGLDAGQCRVVLWKRQLPFKIQWSAQLDGRRRGIQHYDRNRCER